MSGIVLQTNKQTAVLTISREKSLNALNADVLSLLERHLDEIEMDRAIRCLVITGAGEKAFVAGADTRQMEGKDCAAATTLSELGNAIFRKVEEFRCPVIAAVNGYAFGGGCELALSCDIRIAAPSALFGLPETSLGIMPGWGGTQRLARTVGYAKAAEFIFAGLKANAEQALAMGLVSKISEAGKLMDDAMDLAERIGTFAPLAVQQAKKAMLAAGRPALEAGICAESSAFGSLFATKDAQNGLHAFNNKEKYTFRGE